MEDAGSIGEQGNADCPNACGLCGSHIRDTCCALLEVTSRCDLSDCAFCFADSGPRGNDPSLEAITAQIKTLVKPGRTFLQLSGGEPTLRDDLPEIVRAAREMGCKYIQLNSNGIRLARDENFAGALASAGLSFGFLQFDGTDDSIYRRLRGRDLLDVKIEAIDNCAGHNIGVTLVPTLVRGVNTDKIGELIRFAVSRSPDVRGVHFQPVCLMGRAPVDMTREKGGKAGKRFTLDELIHEIRLQAPELTGGAVILPSSCDHPLCGFHSDFIVTEDGGLYPLSRHKARPGADCRGLPEPSDPAEKNREFVGKRWRRPAAACCRGSGDLEDLEYFAHRIKSHSFTLTAMAFQDRWNLDLERLRTCSLHVFKDGRTIPFCAHYLGKS
jgi:uncharacterized radical SAM superfamily Fe-S cluster-containing enzyme